MASERFTDATVIIVLKKQIAFEKKFNRFVLDASFIQYISNSKLKKIWRTNEKIRNFVKLNSMTL